MLVLFFYKKSQIKVRHFDQFGIEKCELYY